MKEFKSEIEYLNKKEEVLSKFRTEFLDEYYFHDPMFRTIANLLINDADPYSIIEQLIIDRKSIVNELFAMKKNSFN